MKYVIGDIHGEFDKLYMLINFLEKDATEYIFLGDYVDKGKNSKKTIDLLNNLSKSRRCIFLIGDHEYAWLKYINGDKRFLNFLINYGGIQTIKSYVDKNLSNKEAKDVLIENKITNNILKTHNDFFSKLIYYYEVNENLICVHAGINPKNKDLLLNFQNKEDLVFIRNEFIYSKFLYQGKKIIFGHTAFKKPYIDKYKIGIDTGAAYREMGILTAFNIEEKIFVDHNRRSQNLNLCMI